MNANMDLHWVVCKPGGAVQTRNGRVIHPNAKVRFLQLFLLDLPLTNYIS